MPPYEANKERAAEYHLTERELEVLCLVCGGLGNKEAGAPLGIAAGTVRIHMMNARRKLDVRTNSGACLRASERGVIRRVP